VEKIIDEFLLPLRQDLIGQWKWARCAKDMVFLLYLWETLKKWTSSEEMRRGDVAGGPFKVILPFTQVSCSISIDSNSSVLNVEINWFENSTN